MTCPHCMNGNKPRFRRETGERVHDFPRQGSFSHTICHDDPKFKAEQEKQRGEKSRNVSGSASK